MSIYYDGQQDDSYEFEKLYQPKIVNYFFLTHSWSLSQQYFIKMIKN
jgi:hypothetical protein